VINDAGLSDAMELAAHASTLERPPGAPAAVINNAWIELLPTFAAWADGRVTDAAALLDRVSGVVPASEWNAFTRGQMNLTLGRVAAAERAFQLMPDPVERELLLGYTALARGDAAGA
jgi:predicted Zn-dependent protease